MSGISSNNKSQNVIQGIEFRYFNILKITDDLKNSKQFCQSLSMIEDLIDNDNLCCYYSHVCNIDLRHKNIFNFEEAKHVIEKTRTFIIDVCHLIEFLIGNLPNEFTILVKRNKTLINGLRECQLDSNIQFHMEVFFIFTKILHQLSHALFYHCSRLYLTNEKDIKKKFETPKTHCLQGDCGKAIERLLFGSVIDAYGRMENDKYIIEYLILSDGRISSVIDKIWINSFVNDALQIHKLKNIVSIECIPFKFLTKDLKRKFESKYFEI
ncbi:unnamed protein product, partial [Rotaria sp. Silwood1]